MAPSITTRRSARRDDRRRSLSVSSTSSTLPSDNENISPVTTLDVVADIALYLSDEKENIDPSNRKNVVVSHKSKRSKRARSSSSSPSQKSSSSQTIKDAASRRTKRALSSRKAPSAEAVEVDVPVPVLMDATEAYTGFAYSGAHFELPPVFTVNTVHTIGDLFFDSFA